MALPRLQLFEFNDAAWAPAVLRDTLVETLSRTIRWGGHAELLVEPLIALLEATGSSEVLDICAGGGGPAKVLSDALAARGVPVHFLLSDLFPHVEEWRAIESQQISFVPEPVDATDIPPALAAGRVRLIINALHHFPPALAREVLRGACRDARGVFIAEGLVRNPLSFVAMGPIGLAALMADPLLAKKDRLKRAAMTWLSPIALAASAWDGTVSAMRQYLPAELHDMVSDLPGWEWSSGEGRHSFGLGRGTWFSGVRRAGADQ